MIRALMLAAILQADPLQGSAVQDTADGSLRAVAFRAGAVALVSRRNATLAGRVGRGDGLQPGMEASLWLPSFLHAPFGMTDIGVSGRIFGGDFSKDSSDITAGSEAVGNVANIDLDVFAGRRFLHARLGAGLRRFSGAFRSVDRTFVRVGARSLLALGTTREFEVMLGATVYLGVRGGKGGSGREAETRLIFSPQCGRGGVVSLICGRTYVIAGYRFEQFTANAVSQVGGDQPEEIGSLIFGAGVKFPSTRD